MNPQDGIYIDQASAIRIGEALEAKLAPLEAKLDKLEKRLDQLGSLFGKIGAVHTDVEATRRLVQLLMDTLVESFADHSEGVQPVSEAEVPIPLRLVRNDR